MEHVLVKAPLDDVALQVTDFIKNKGFKIFDDIDQCAEAAKVDLKIPATRLIIFGNPKVGTLLMQENDDITFELPIKILLIAKKNGTAMIYRDPNDFPGNNQLQEQGKQIIAQMHQMYQEMMQAVKDKIND